MNQYTPPDPHFWILMRKYIQISFGYLRVTRWLFMVTLLQVKEVSIYKPFYFLKLS